MGAFALTVLSWLESVLDVRSDSVSVPVSDSESPGETGRWKSCRSESLQLARELGVLVPSV